jgi:PhnB protein
MLYFAKRTSSSAIYPWPSFRYILLGEDHASVCQPGQNSRQRSSEYTTYRHWQLRRDAGPQFQIIEQESVMQVQPYLFYNGRCEEALEFYRKAVGAQVEFVMRFKESPEPPQPGMVPPGSENKIMHSSFRIGDTVLMASDGQCVGTPKFDGFSLSISAPDTGKAEEWFKALSSGGKVTMPLTKTFFAESFGMVADPFGMNWMVIVDAK